MKYKNIDKINKQLKKAIEKEKLKAFQLGQPWIYFVEKNNKEFIVQELPNGQIIQQERC